jgi:hypothetical protein
MASSPVPDPNRELFDIRRRLYFGDAGGPAVDPTPLDPHDGIDLSAQTDLEPALSPDLFRKDAHDPAPADDRSAALVAGLRDQNEDLLRENTELRTLLKDLKHLLEEASQHDPELAAQREEELKRQLAEKDEANALLHAQLQEIERQLTEAAAPPPSEEDLEALSDELEQERCRLTKQQRDMEDERRQLRDDEEALMNQMREMEVAMARERAEMARQRTELQRLHTEVRYELEQLQRGDGVLTARLAQFQRRSQELQARHGMSASPTPDPRPPAAPPAAPEAPEAPPRRDSGSGFVRRLFGDR